MTSINKKIISLLEAKVDVETPDIDALFKNDEFSEEFQTKAKTIFEGSVIARVNEVVKQLQETTELALVDYKKEMIEENSTLVTNLLNSVTEKFLEENKIAIDNGFKLEITETFFNKMKDLFKESVINLPEEEIIILQQKESEIERLKLKLSEETEDRLKLINQLNNFDKTTIITQLKEGMSLIQAEKFQLVVEQINYVNKADFTNKVKIIKEASFVSNSNEKSSDAGTFVVENNNLENKDTWAEDKINQFNNKRKY